MDRFWHLLWANLMPCKFTLLFFLIPLYIFLIYGVSINKVLEGCNKYFLTVWHFILVIQRDESVATYLGWTHYLCESQLTNYCNLIFIVLLTSSIKLLTVMFLFPTQNFQAQFSGICNFDTFINHWLGGIVLPIGIIRNCLVIVFTKRFMQHFARWFSNQT
jgi:hypothetical protein